MMKLRIGIILASAAIAGVAAADGVIGPSKQTCFSESTHTGEKTPMFPAFWKICADLGKSREACGQNEGFGALTDYSQTNKANWYTGTESNPDNVPSKSCIGAIPIQRYTMMDGRKGTDYACHAEEEDDTITDYDIAQIAKAAKDLNAKVKTFGDHEKAVQIKRYAEYLAKQP